MAITPRTFMRAAIMLAVVAASAVSPPAVFADERLCGQHRAELASAPTPGGSPEYREYSQAARAQREQIMIARRRARDTGCGFYAQAGKPGCAPINAKIDRMERNLASLERRQAEIAREEGRRMDRSRILAALNANECGDPRLADREKTPRPSLEEPIPPEGDRSPGSTLFLAGPRPTSVQENLAPSTPGNGGDSNTPPRNFTIIAGNPPAAAPLANPVAPEPPIAKGDAAPPGMGAVSPADDRQAVLPDTQHARSPSVMEVAVPAQEPGTLPAPQRTDTPNLSAPVEKPADRREELTAGRPPPAEAAPHDPGQRKVRVVGPTFLPDPEEIITGLRTRKQ